MTLKIHVARKEHACTLCGKEIKKGSRYWRDHDEDGLTDRKEHISCPEDNFTANGQD